MLFSMYLLIVVLFLLRRRQCVICLARRHLLIPCLMGVSSRWVCHLVKFVPGMSVSSLVEMCGVLWLVIASLANWSASSFSGMPV